MATFPFPPPSRTLPATAPPPPQTERFPLPTKEYDSFWRATMKETAAERRAGSFTPQNFRSLYLGCFNRPYHRGAWPAVLHNSPEFLWGAFCVIDAEIKRLHALARADYDGPDELANLQRNAVSHWSRGTIPAATAAVLPPVPFSPPPVRAPRPVVGPSPTAFSQPPAMGPAPMASFMQLEQPPEFGGSAAASPAMMAPPPPVVSAASNVVAASQQGFGVLQPLVPQLGAMAPMPPPPITAFPGFNQDLATCGYWDNRVPYPQFLDNMKGLGYDVPSVMLLIDTPLPLFPGDGNLGGGLGDAMAQGGLEGTVRQDEPMPQALPRMVTPAGMAPAALPSNYGSAFAPSLLTSTSPSYTPGSSQSINGEPMPQAFQQMVTPAGLPSFGVPSSYGSAFAPSLAMDTPPSTTPGAYQPVEDSFAPLGGVGAQFGTPATEAAFPYVAVRLLQIEFDPIGSAPELQMPDAAPETLEQTEAPLEFDYAAFEDALRIERDLSTGVGGVEGLMEGGSGLHF